MWVWKCNLVVKIGPAVWPRQGRLASGGCQGRRRESTEKRVLGTGAAVF